MNDENNYGAPVLDDIDYVAPAPKKGGPTGVSAPVLDDMDVYTPPPSQKKGAPTGVTAPVLDDDDAPYNAPKEEKKPVMTDEEIIARFSAEQLATYNGLPEANKEKVLELMRKQLGVEAPTVEIKAPVLDEDNYIPPPKKAEPEKPSQPEAPVSAPILDDEPAPTVYKPKYVDEDLERAKQEAKKTAVSSQLVSEQKDSKESLRMMLELKEELRREAAKKGFRIVIIMAIVGIIGAAAFYLLYSGSLGLTYKDGMSGIANIIKDSAMYITIAMVGTALFMISGLGITKTLASLVFLASSVIQVFPGCIMIPQHEGSMALVCILYAVSIICSIAVFVSLAAIEPVALYFKKELR